MIILFIVYGALFVALASLPIWMGDDAWRDISSGATGEERPG